MKRLSKSICILSVLFMITGAAPVYAEETAEPAEETEIVVQTESEEQAGDPAEGEEEVAEPEETA